MLVRLFLYSNLDMTYELLLTSKMNIMLSHLIKITDPCKFFGTLVMALDGTCFLFELFHTS